MNWTGGLEGGDVEGWRVLGGGVEGEGGCDGVGWRGVIDCQVKRESVM